MPRLTSQTRTNSQHGIELRWPTTGEQQSTASPGCEKPPALADRDSVHRVARSVAAQILLQWGADVLAENNELRTPLKLAQSMAHNSTVEVLQQHAREEAEMMMSVRAELTEKRKQTAMAAAGVAVTGLL